MRIIVVTGIFPPDIGGPASYVPRISGSLVSNGHTVEVVTLADADAMAGAQAFPFKVHRVERQLPRAKRMAKVVSLVCRLARPADVVFINGLVLESIIAAKLASKPTVVKVVGDAIWEKARNAGLFHSLDNFQTASLPLRWKALRKLQGGYTRLADRVITPSEYLKSVVSGWGVGADLIDVVYNAVPVSLHEEVLPEPDVDLVSVGRLVPWKGFEQLISCAAENGWSLRIVGDGPLRTQLEAQARNSGAAVEFAGHIPQVEVARFMRRAKAFVLNSSYEGLPHIVLEAMACGVPVIATAAGGTPETIIDGRTGILIPVSNAERLQAGISRLLRDEGLRRELASNATARLLDRFSYERMVRETEAVLFSVATAANRQHAV